MLRMENQVSEGLWDLPKVTALGDRADSTVTSFSTPPTALSNQQGPRPFKWHQLLSK